MTLVFLTLKKLKQKVAKVQFFNTYICINVLHFCAYISKKCICIYIEIEKVDVFRKVLNKQFNERLKAISIINNIYTYIYIYQKSSQSAGKSAQ